MSCRSKIGDILILSADKVALVPADIFVRVFPNTGGIIFLGALTFFSFVITTPITMSMMHIGSKLKRNG